MKRFLLLVLLLAIGNSAMYAQTSKRKKSSTKKTTSKKAPAKKKVVSNNNLIDNNMSVTAPVDTAKAIAPPPPLDGYFRKSNILDAKVTPYPLIREADVMYSKRIWRVIDLRLKMNRPFASPKARLIDIIMSAVMSGELTAYDATQTLTSTGDDFKTILQPSQAMGKFADSVLIPEIDKDGNQTGAHMAAGEYKPDSILQFQIKEDWIFDKQRSVFEPRIIGIAPMYAVKAAGQNFGEVPAFWIYFPEARQIFATKEVVSRSNDATGLSYDDVFVKRIFDSYIIKESNPDDLRIKDYIAGTDQASGVQKLYESQRIKKELMNYEHDLWSY